MQVHRFRRMVSSMIAHLPPGSRVHVLAGSFIGMSGVIVSAADAKALRDDNAAALRIRNGSPLTDNPGYAWVALTIFGRQVPVELEASVLRAGT